MASRLIRELCKFIWDLVKANDLVELVDIVCCTPPNLKGAVIPQSTIFGIKTHAAASRSDMGIIRQPPRLLRFTVRADGERWGTSLRRRSLYAKLIFGRGPRELVIDKLNFARGLTKRLEEKSFVPEVVVLAARLMAGRLTAVVSASKQVSK